MIQYFNPTSTHPKRALQAWQILIAAAMNRQTHTYKSLSLLMYQKQATGVLGGVLAHIAFYCNQNDLPPLTVLVVNEKSGLPGDQIPVSHDLNELRETVYDYDWYNLYPPTEQELIEANENHQFK